MTNYGRHLLTALLLLLLAFSANADEQGTVSLTLQRFLELTQSKSGPKDGPPLASALGAASYTVSADRDWAEIRAQVQVQTFRGGWNEIDLLPGHVLVARAYLDGKPLPVYLKDGRLRFMLKGAGRHSLSLVYHLPVKDSGPSHELSLVTPKSSPSQLKLRLPHKHVHLSSSPAIPLQEVSGQKGVVMDGVLPREGAAVLTWTPLEVHPELRGKATDQKPKIYARLYYLATVTEKAIRSKVQVDYSILRNQLGQLELAVPQGTEVVNVSCPGLASWSLKETPEERRLIVELNSPWSGNQSLHLTLERPIPSIDSTWNLPLVRVLGAERIKGSLGIGASPGIEVSQETSEEVRPIDVTQLPPQLTSQASSPLLLAYEYHQDPFQVTLKTSKGKELAVLTASIDQAQATTLISKEGKIATVFVYNVRNNRKQSMTFELPHGLTILNAYVDNKGVKPVMESETKIRLPLVLSNSADASFSVQLTTLSEGGAFTPMVVTELVAPVVDVPISELLWQVYLPSDREVWRRQGSMQAASHGHFQPKSDLPVSLLVPQVGQRLSFEQLMVAEEAASIKLVHSSRMFRDGLWWFVLGAVLMLGSAPARKPQGWKRVLAGGGLVLVVSQLVSSTLIRSLLGAGFLGITVLAAACAVGNRSSLVDWVKSRKPEPSPVEEASAAIDELLPEDQEVEPASPE